MVLFGAHLFLLHRIYKARARQVTNFNLSRNAKHVPYEYEYAKHVPNEYEYAKHVPYE